MQPSRNTARRDREPPMIAYAHPARCLPAVLCALWAAAAAAQQPAVLPNYSLFNPTPDARLRDFSTDRPGKAQNPVTVDAGHFQLESDLVNYSDDRWSPDGDTTRQTTYGDPELKLGLANWAEADITLPLYTTQTQRDGRGHVTHARGNGDLLLGGKVNVFGNSGAGNAFGALLTVKLPTAAPGLGNNMVEATVALPLVIDLPAGFSTTLESAFGLMREQQKQGYAGDYQVIANLNHKLGASPVTAAIELALDYSSDPNTGTRDTIDATLQWQVTKTLQLDGGINLGITKAAPDLNPYLGIATRF